MPRCTSTLRTKVITRGAFFVLLLLICFPVHAQITLAIGQGDTPATASSNAQSWPGCSSGCLPNNPAYVLLPGSTRRVWTNVCSGTNQWGGAGYPTDAPKCTYPASVAVTWTLNSGTCTVPQGQTTAYGTIGAPVGSATQLCSITVTTVQDITVSVTFHVLVVKPAADTLSNSASMALHYCGSSGVATCTYVAPFYEVLYQGQYADLQAYVSGKTNMAVTWAVSPNNGGLVILNGTSNRDIALQAVNAGTYTVTAISIADGTSSAAAKIVVTANSLAGQKRTSKVTPIDCTPQGSGTTYEATDDTTFAAVPWDTLAAGDTVRIHAKPALAPYAIPFQIKTSGTAAQPIRICGVPDASGNLPILTGVNAGPGNVTAAQQPYGMVVLVGTSNVGEGCSRGAGCSQPPEPDTHNVIVEGLKVMSADTPYGRTGGAAAWLQGCASFRVEARDIVLRGNEITVSDDGLFVGSTNSRGESTVTRRLAVEGNYIYANGDLTSGSSSFHNNYLQGDMLLYQWNWVGVVRSGSQGSSVKIRSAYSVVRYNYIQGSSRNLDMVEVQDWSDLAIPWYYYSDNQPSSNPGDPTSIADVAAVVEHVQSDYVYGNVFDNNSLLGTSPGDPFHYFCDVFPNAEKGGIDYFYFNTDREIHDQTGTYADGVFMWDSTTGQCGVPKVWPRFELTNNVIDLECATSGCTNGKFNYSPTVAYQDIVAVDKNWFTSGWNTTNWGSGPAPYWSGCCSSPTNWGSSCYQTSCVGGTGKNNVTGESNVVSGAIIPFNSTTFMPIAGSPLANAAAPLPQAVSDLPPEFAYHPDTQVVTARADIQSNSPATIGALDAVTSANRPAPPTISVH